MYASTSGGAGKKKFTRIPKSILLNSKKHSVERSV